MHREWVPFQLELGRESPARGECIKLPLADVSRYQLAVGPQVKLVRITSVSPVPVDPLRHEPLVAEAFVRNGAPFDPCKLLREGYLL